MNTQINYNTNTYSTSDIGLAAMLSLNFPLISVNRDDPKKALFIFPLKKELSAIVDSYWNNELKVEPRRFFSEIKSLKVRLYSGN